MGPSGENELALNFDALEQISPRSLTSDELIAELQIDSGDSISQRFNFDHEDVRKSHYRQNQSNHSSPRAAKYRESGGIGSKAKLARVITVPGESRSDHVNHHKTQDNNATKNRVITVPGERTATEIHEPIRGSIHKSYRNTEPHIPTSGGTLRKLDAANFGGSIRGYAASHLTHSSRQHLPNDYNSSVAFRRRRNPHERKEYSVSRFDVQLSQHERHRYLPGEELRGKILFEMNSEIEIRFVELLILGQTTASFIHKGSGKATTKRDIFLSKRSYIMGSADGRFSSIIQPGHYVSNFCFQLPDSIPSSVHYEDRINGFNLDIAYLVKVRLCDDLGNSSTRSTHSMNNLVKVLLSRRQMFTVRRPFDIHSVPNGLSPVIHNESVSLSCSFLGKAPANISMELDRTCFLAGDEIKVRLETQSKHASKIKKVACILQQSVSVSGIRSTAVFNIASVEEKYPRGTVCKRSHRSVTGYEIILPTLNNFLPSVLHGCRNAKVKYHVLVGVTFGSCSGKLLMETPISLGPCTDHIVSDKKNAVPMFNRPMRFTGNFAPDQMNGHARAAAIEKRNYYKAKVNSKMVHGSCSNNFCCCTSDSSIE